MQMHAALSGKVDDPNSECKAKKKQSCTNYAIPRPDIRVDEERKVQIPKTPMKMNSPEPMHGSSFS
jgi:hypothetical protein